MKKINVYSQEKMLKIKMNPKISQRIPIASTKSKKVRQSKI